MKLNLFAEEIFCGSVAGCASVLVCHPIDVIRTKLQIVDPTFVRTAKSTSLTFQSMYAGISGPICAQTVYKSIIFSCYSYSNKYLFPTEKSPRTIFVSGSIAGFVNSIIVSPVELFRTQSVISCYGSRNGGAIHSMSRLIKYSWRTLLPTIARDCPGLGFYFCTFHMLQNNCSSNNVNDTSSKIYLCRLLAGACAGISFWVWALPFDTFKTNLESSLRLYSSLSARQHMLLIGKHLLEQRGFLGLYRSWPVALGRGIPSAAITLTTYDTLKDWTHDEV